MPARDALTLGVSQCLLGDGVRYDGGHKANSFVLNLLAPHFNLVGVCPEVESGMGVPREAVQLRADDESLRMVGTESGTDYTHSINSFSIRRVEELSEAGLCGYIFKSNSPSCGLEAPVAAEGAAPGHATGPGLFAGAVLRAFPDLPVAQEGALGDTRTREGFVEQVFAYSRLVLFFSRERSVGQLAMAHAQAKLQLDAHRPGAHAEIQQLFRRASEMTYAQLCDEYRTLFMAELSEPATVNQHFDVLKGIFAGMKAGLGPAVAKELARTLQDYRLGTVPLSVPLTLLRHYARVGDDPMLNGQTYLDPEPRELLLRVQV